VAKITDKAALTTPAVDDVIHVVDVSDITSSAAGTSKQVELQYIRDLGVSTILGLTDTPSAFTAAGNKVLAVNAGATAVEFTATPTITNANVTEVTDKNYVTDAEAILIGTALQSETSHADVLVDADIGVNVQAYDATIVVDADIGVTVAAQSHVTSHPVPATRDSRNEVADATILKDADIGVTVAAQSHVTSHPVPATRDSRNEVADATILKDADIGVTVAAVLGADDNYVTDAQAVVIGNTSGTNTGDQTAAGALTLDASGFNGVLTTTDDTVQEVAQKLDDLVLTGLVAKTSATGSAVMPKGTALERDGSPLSGYMRFNTDDSTFEGHDGVEWGSIGGGGVSWEVTAIGVTAVSGAGYLERL